MQEWKEVTDVVEVPKNTGLDGFLQVVKTYLRVPRVQDMRIDARGRVTVRRFAPPDDSERNVGIDFSSLSPSGIIRNTQVEEVAMYEGANAAVVLGGMLDRVATEKLKPLAFMTGADSVLWDWYKMTTGVRLRNKDSLHGLSLYTDRALPDTALLLVVGYGKDAALVDARASYKLEMPVYEFPDTTVEVL
jgi:hypothetical protein